MLYAKKKKNYINQVNKYYVNLLDWYYLVFTQLSDKMEHHSRIFSTKYIYYVDTSVSM